MATGAVRLLREDVVKSIGDNDALEADWWAAAVVIRRRRAVAVGWAALYLAGLLAGAVVLAVRSLELLGG